jgi:SAM-dependent methyltransferase
MRPRFWEMKLWQVRRHWDALANDDPFWAVLTQSQKQGNRWAIDEFYETGVAEVAADIAEIRMYAPNLRMGRALDFGCGTGRLTAALARHFERVTGVDISARMVALAKEHCHEARVQFVHNVKPDLRILADGSFDFVYSRITLQHVAPRYSRRYLAEFIRVLAPGGILSVQIPDRVPAGDPPDRLRFSIWPPTMWMRIRRHIRYHHPGWFPGAPKMQMYRLPKAEAEAIIARAGAQLLSAKKSEHGDVDNYIYIARKNG